jgi:hypothetical protein
LLGDVLEHLVQRLRLDLFPLELRARVVEVEHDAALLELLDEELIPVLWSDVYATSQFVSLLTRNWRDDAPMKFGSFSMSTRSVT